MSNTSRSRATPRRGLHAARAVRRTVRGAGEVSSLEAHLGYWLRFVSNHVSHAFKLKVERQGVTVAEWVVLRTLFDEDGIRSSDVSARVGLTRGAVSKLLTRLAAKDLVAVGGDALDGRAQLVTLTAAGRRLVPKLAALADENDQQAFGHLSGDQRGMLVSVLKDLVDRIGISDTPID